MRSTGRVPTLVIRDVDQLIERLDGSRLTFAGLQGAKNLEPGGDRGYSGQ